MGRKGLKGLVVVVGGGLVGRGMKGCRGGRGLEGSWGGVKQHSHGVGVRVWAFPDQGLCYECIQVFVRPD